VDAAVAESVCRIRERVADRIGQNRFRTWFGEATQFELTDDRLDVMVENAFAGRWISTNYMSELIEATREVTGSELRVDIRVAAPNGRPKQDNPRRVAQPGSHTTPRPRTDRRRTPTLRGELESFVVGPPNRLAHAAVCSIVNSLEQAVKPLVMHGGCGLGKTHLLQGVCNGVRRAHPAVEWRYISGEEFTNEYIYALKAGRIDHFRARFRKVDLLVIDDIHFLANKKATQEEFLHTFNAIDACGKVVVLSSDRHPRSIATLSEPLINRLVAGMVVRIDPPDLAMRREILRRRALEMGQRVPDGVLELVAQHVTRNVRELEGALYKLVALASLAREAITPDIARRALEDYINQQRPPDAAAIERVVAAHFGVTREQIRSKSRDRTVSLARAITMYLVRKHTRLSFPEIGRALGNKNHSTVLMATQRMERILERDGSVFWKSLSGKHEDPLQAVLTTLERQLGRRDTPSC
jgi:chromosomal replication initiator protein